MNPKTADVILALNQISDVEELRAVNRACIDRLREVQRLAVRELSASGTLSKGTRVSFESRKLRHRISGTVVKINQKTVQVQSDAGALWNVGASQIQIEPSVTSK